MVRVLRGLGSGGLTKFSLSCKSASSSKVLDTRLLMTGFAPDEDGVIDLTTPENDALSAAVGAQVMGRRPPGGGS
jgi:hypothetical protein